MQAGARTIMEVKERNPIQICLTERRQNRGEALILVLLYTKAIL